MASKKSQHAAMLDLCLPVSVMVYQRELIFTTHLLSVKPTETVMTSLQYAMKPLVWSCLLTPPALFPFSQVATVLSR